ASIRSRASAIPAVDTAAEARVVKERTLRNQANDLLHDGNVADAAKKFEELQKLAPKSPYVLGVNTKLTELRRQSESKQQQLVQAKQFFDQGMVLFNNKQYADAVKAFDESFHLNPNSDDAANYLKLAQQEDERARTEQAHANPQLKSVVRPTVAPATARGGQRSSAAQTTGPAQITTTFASQVTDGYIMVRIGGDVVAHENLWQGRVGERPSAFGQRPLRHGSSRRAVGGGYSRRVARDLRRGDRARTGNRRPQSHRRSLAPLAAAAPMRRSGAAHSPFDR